MLEDKINKFIQERFNIIYAISMYYQTYLIGGAIRDIMIDKEPRDLDFVLHSMNNDYVNEFIKDFIDKYDLKYSINHFNGYKIIYNYIEVDLWHTTDLFNSIEYNADGLLYDIQKHQLLSLTFDDFLINGPRRINDTINANNKSDERLLKLKKFYNDIKSKGM